MTTSYALPERAFFHFTGPDAQRYLQGQITQDLQDLVPGRALASFVTDVKGRILAYAYVRAYDSGYLLDAEAHQAEELQTRLERYLIADDATISNPSVTLLHFPEAVPLDGLGSEVYVCSRVTRQGYDVLLPTRELASVLPELKSCELLTPKAWESLRVANALPADCDIRSLFPAETGLEDTAVSFHKGCYLGQEVISRMKRAGKTNRCLAAFQLKPHFAGSLPAEICSEGKTIGAITSVASSGHALGCLQTKHLHEGSWEVPLGEAQGCYTIRLSFVLPGNEEKVHTERGLQKPLEQRNA